MNNNTKTIPLNAYLHLRVLYASEMHKHPQTDTGCQVLMVFYTNSYRDDYKKRFSILKPHTVLNVKMHKDAWGWEVIGETLWQEYGHIKKILFALNSILEAIHLRSFKKLLAACQPVLVMQKRSLRSLKFTYGQIYWKLLGNLILYAACSLFQARQLAKVNLAY